MRDISATSAVILAGGRSQRFGSDKRELEIGGERLLSRMARECALVFGEVIIAGGEPNARALPGVRAVPDVYPGMGPMAGLHAGLAASRFEACFALACDMPFFDPGLAARIIPASEGFDVFVPIHDGGCEPLFAVYASSLAPEAAALLERGAYSLRELWKRPSFGLYQVEKDVAEKAFFNINRPEDLELFLRSEDHKK